MTHGYGGALWRHGEISADIETLNYWIKSIQEAISSEREQSLQIDIAGCVHIHFV